MADDGLINPVLKEAMRVQMPETGDRPGSSPSVGIAPVRALRAVFSGIGQMLMAADRLRAEDAREQSQVPEQPASPRPWGVSVTPSVRLIPPDGSADSGADDPGAAAGEPGLIGTSARPAPPRPPSKSRPAGKPKRS